MVDFEALLSEDKEVRMLFLEALGKALHLEFINEIIKKDAVDTGFIIETSNVRVVDENKVVISFPADYASDLEFGPGPHKPDITQLFGWARRKLKLSGKEAESAAYAVWHKLAKVGYEGRRYVRDPLERYII